MLKKLLEVGAGNELEVASLEVLEERVEVGAGRGLEVGAGNELEVGAGSTLA